MEIIDDAKKDFPIKSLCTALEIKRNTYYARLKSAQRIDTHHEVLKEHTLAIHKQVV